MIEAGADVRVITPALGEHPVFLAGFQGDRRATEVHLDLCVRTLALRGDGARPVVLSVCDLIGLLRSDTLAIRSAVAELDADVVVASTHSHAGPDTIGFWGPDPASSGVDEAFMASVRTTVTDSIRAALAALEPAVLRFATTEIGGMTENVRDPEILDEQICAMAVDRPDATAIATLVNVPVHPEVLGEDSTLISGDLAGACARALEVARGGSGIWTSAALGGMQSPAEGPRTPEEAERRGALCAAATLSALVQAPVEDDAPVTYRGTEVTLPLWSPRFNAAIDAGVLPKDLRRDGTLVTEVGVLQLGAVRMACWPGEVLPSLGMISKTRLESPCPFLIGLANDEIGYILPPELWTDPTDWDDPGPQYEESMSVGPMTGPLLLAALDELLAG